MNQELPLKKNSFVSNGIEKSPSLNPSISITENDSSMENNHRDRRKSITHQTLPVNTTLTSIKKKKN